MMCATHTLFNLYKYEQDYDKMKARKTEIGGSHYIEMAVQPWDVVDTWPIEQQIGFHRGNVIKYLMRLGSKDDPLQEAKKAQHYLTKLVELLETDDDLC